MNLIKNDTNNAIITKLDNVRPHSNADRLQLATVLGAQVIVGLDAKDDDLVIYFDSNLRLSHEYLHLNNLYSNKELNSDPTQKGYFGKNGRVRAQKFRGEVSNGYVADLESLNKVSGVVVNGIGMYWSEGTQFTSINGVEICSKFIILGKHSGQAGKPNSPISTMFHKHWDTKHLMRELDSIPGDTACYIEEKIHGTSGRTGNVLCKTNRSWWKFWKPKKEWKVVSGTRRVDNISYHLSEIRKEVERRVSPHLHKGEAIYYEIYGYDQNGAMIQPGFPYDCIRVPGAWDNPNNPAPFKAMLYRVTITTPDGYVVDLNRRQVYARAAELGLEKPYLISKTYTGDNLLQAVKEFCLGRSRLDIGTLLEGIAVWFEDSKGNWKCLKHKSAEFLISQDKNYEKGVGDVEDEL